MGSIGLIYNTLLINPTVNLLLVFLLMFNTWKIPGAFGWSIITLTVFIRLLLHPLFAKQLKTAKDIELLRPKLDALNKKYKNDKQKLQREQLKLYQEQGINPAAGCVTGLVQMPIFLALYQVLQLFLVAEKPQDIISKVNQTAYSSTFKIASIDPWFFGFNLSLAPSHFREAGVYYLIVPLVTAALQYYQIVLSSPQPAKKAQPEETKKGKKAEKTPDDMQTAMAKQMRIMFPLMIGYFSYILPVGLALYWNIFSIFTIINSKKMPSWNTQKK